MGSVNRQGRSYAGRSGEERAAERRAAFLDRRGVILGLAELQQRDDVVEVLLDLLVALDGRFPRLTLAHHLLRACRIVPECGIFCLAIEIAKPHVGRIPVKETSAGGPWTP